MDGQLGQLPPRSRSRRRPDLKLVVAGATVAMVAASCSSAPAASGARTTPTATQGVQRLRLSPRRLTGVVRAVGASYLEIRDKGLTVTLELAPTTRYRQGGHRTGEQALAVGERVRVLFAKGPKPKAATVVVLPATITGTVRSLSSEGFTPMVRAGHVDTVKTTPATRYRSGKGPTTAVALRVGEGVRVSGNRASNGSTTAAPVAILGNRVEIAPKHSTT